MARREFWHIVNLTGKHLNIGDLPKLPALLSKGHSEDLLAYHSTDAIGNSKELKNLFLNGSLSLAKEVDGVRTVYSRQKAVNAVSSAQEGEAKGVKNITSQIKSTIFVVKSDTTTQSFEPATNSNADRGSALTTALATASAGDVVHLSVGTFSSGGFDPLWTVPSGVTLRGEGPKRTVLSYTGGALTGFMLNVDSSNNNIIDSVGLDGGSNITGGISCDSATNLRIKDIQVDSLSDATNYAVEGDLVTTLKIEDGRFNCALAVFLDSSSDVLIESNKFTGLISFDDTDDFTISHNFSIRTAAGTNILLKDISGGVVNANIIKSVAPTEGTDEACIHVQASPDVSSSTDFNVAITNNICRLNWDGIVAEGKNATIEGNDCSDHNRYGIRILGSQIIADSNICLNNKDAGIAVQGAIGADGKDIVIANNYLENNGRDSFDGDATGQIHLGGENTMYETMFASSVLIEGNMIRRGDDAEPDSPLYGIVLDDEDNGGVTDCVVRANDFQLSNFDGNILDNGVNTHIEGNINIRPSEEKVYVEMTNGSGTALAADDLVVLKATADGNTVTTTTTDPDPAIFGGVIEAIADGDPGRVQILGKGTLKVTGTISLGDTLGSSTASTRAASATASGDTVIARALEASTTNTTIDVLFIRPLTL